jgi:hypothetical protein
MLTDKDICDIKELAYRSGMDYFVKEEMRQYKPYYSEWIPRRSQHDLPLSGEYVLYQKLPFQDRTLYVCIASFMVYPSIYRFEHRLYILGFCNGSYNLYDLYNNYHPDFIFKSLYAERSYIFDGYLPTH